MNNLRLVTLTLFSIFFASCSNSDDSDNSNMGPLEGNYFPLTIDNYWNYEIETVDNLDTLNNSTSSDFLFVESQVDSAYDLSVNTNDLANGIMNGILANGILTRLVSSLKIDGTLQLPLEEFGDFGIDFTNIVLYDLNASNNQEMSSASGNFIEDFNGTPITINYSLITKNLGNSNSMTVSGQLFSNITKSNLTVNLSIVTPLDVNGNVVNLTILEDQEVVSIDNYFAENVGLIKSETDLSYQLDSGTLALLEAADIVIDAPTELNVENEQELSDYDINE